MVGVCICEVQLQLSQNDHLGLRQGACQISSPSTVSPSSSQEDRKIDLLFNGSSPDTDPHPTEVLEAVKMGPSQSLFTLMHLLNR